jgi:hypothetical protein
MEFYSTEVRLEYLRRFNKSAYIIVLGIADKEGSAQN